MLTNAQKVRIKTAFEHSTRSKLEDLVDHSAFHAIARAVSPRPSTELEFTPGEIEDAKQRAFEEAVDDLDLFETRYEFMDTGDFPSEEQKSEITSYLTELKKS